MSANTWQTQQDVSSVLKKIEVDIRDFAGCLKRAEATVNQDDQEGYRTELEMLSGRLQDHRTEIRRWSAQLDARAKGRLGAARAHIEQELRRFKMLESKFRPKEFPKQGGDKITASKDKAASEAPGAEAPGLGAREAEVVPESVKVIVEQLIQDGSEKGDMAEEFVCKICLVHLVGCKPKLTTCSHLFCGDCLEKWFAVQPGSQSWARRACSTGTVPCPVCKEKLNEERDLHLVSAGGSGGSLLLWQMLAEMPIVCANHPKCNPEGKCDWRGKYGTYQEHIRECKNMPMFSASTSPTVTPELTHAASRSDEDLDCLHLDPSSSEDEFATDDAAGLSHSPMSEPRSEFKAAEEGSLPLQQAEEVPIETPQCAAGPEPFEANKSSTSADGGSTAQQKFEEDPAQLSPPPAEPESGSERTLPRPVIISSAEVESGGATPSAMQAAVPEEEVEPPHGPTALKASMADLTSLIGALYELKVQERVRSQQAAGEGAASVPPSAPTAAPPYEPAPVLAGAQEPDDQAPGASAAPPTSDAKPVQSAQELDAEALGAFFATPHKDGAKPKPSGQETSADVKKKQAAQSAAAAEMALAQEQMQSADAVRVAQIQAAQWHAAQWQMAQAAQWQQWQAAQFQAAQWQAARRAAAAQKPRRH
mmetsp:Transcript_24639/g.70901  ORF Transcript_24639/g.70901 Transcript_24639/m.70901 type:complete len:649 (-) Transcript_24639:159-2105(-)